LRAEGAHRKTLGSKWVKWKKAREISLGPEGSKFPVAEIQKWKGTKEKTWHPSRTGNEQNV